MNLPQNVGKTDKYLRIGAGLGLLALALSGIIGVWGYIGIVPLLTGLFSTCPLYSIIGASTCPRK